MIDLENTESFGLKEIVEGIEFYYLFIKKVNPSFFLRSPSENLPYSPREIEATISLAKRIKTNYIIVLTHLLIELALNGIEFYRRKLEKEFQSIDEQICSIIYSELIILIDAAMQLILSFMRNSIEEKIVNLTENEATRKITRERQELRYNEFFPKKVIDQHKDYLNNRLEDFKELVQLEKEDYSSELREIITSYNRGLKINIKGKNLVEPLLNHEFPNFIERLRELLYIPSFFDITGGDKERIFHIYLLGVLEGRMVFYNVFSNKESGIGRYDICVSPINNNNPGLIIEIKTGDKDLSSGKIEADLTEALNQIDNKSYFIQLKNEGVTVILAIGILFQKKKPYIKHKIINC